MTPEAAIVRQSFFQRLGEMFKNFFFHKGLQEAEKKAKKAERKRLEKETRAAWEEEGGRREREDRERAYHERESKQDLEEALNNAGTIQAEIVKQRFDQFIENQARLGPDFDELNRDPNLRDNINQLIESNQASTVVVMLNQLAVNSNEIMADPAKLINFSRSLLYEAKKIGRENDLAPLITGIKNRLASHLIPEAVKVYEDDARRRFGKGFEERVVEKLDIRLTDEQIQNLMGTFDRNPTKEEVDRHRENALVDILKVEKTPREGEADWMDRVETPTTAEPPQKLISRVSEIWREVEQAEKTGEHLPPEKLYEKYRAIQASESSFYPSDVVPGTEAYDKAVRAARTFTEGRLNTLADKLNARLKAEMPQVKHGIRDTKEFLDEMVRNPGRLGILLDANSEMEKLLVGYVPKEDIEKSIRFRDQVFLTIHSQILTDKHSSSRDNFGLYEKADFTTFVSIIRSKMADLTRKETGMPYGQTWVEWYVNLSNTIQQSRDIDFWASQPGVNMDEFFKSYSLFQNDYSVQAMSIPAVEQAYRSYETTLRSIRDSNDGYIPPAMVGYSSQRMTSQWDDLSQILLRRMIDAGVVHDIKRDEVSGFHLLEPDGNTLKLGGRLSMEKLRKEDPQNLQLQMYMTLAKGFGLVSGRFLEIFAHAKVPGSERPGFAAGSFHSIPYEGPARAFNYYATWLDKWRMGSYRYLQIMNTLLPSEKRFPINAEEPMKAYVAYRNGTFEKIYGKEAKRLFDILNFSGQSSAFGLNYKWRQLDSTLGWSDRKRELLGGSILIHLSEKYAEDRVKEYLTLGKYREKFRELMGSKGKATSGPEFDKLWKERGMTIYGREIDREWEKMTKDKKTKKEIDTLINKYKKAFVARIWVQAAMRNPLTVAHNMEVDVPDEISGERKIRLHSYIVQQVLGIPLEDTKYGEVAGRSTPDSTPTERQLGYMEEVIGLEADLAAVREIAIKENREIRDSDFEIIKSATNRAQAKKYWDLTKKALFGDEDHQHLYEQFGLKLAENGEDYAVDWDKIGKIDQTLEHIGKHTVVLDGGAGPISVLLNEEMVDKKWEVLSSTEDTAFRQMALNNLGSRQWVRLGGDAAAHYHGGERSGKYLEKDLTPNPQAEDLAKALLEVNEVYSGDAREAAWRVVGPLAHATTRLYAYDYKRLGSAAQLDVWKTRRGVAAWNANGRRKFFDALQHMDVLPPTADAWGYKMDKMYNIHELRKANRAGNVDVWTEIILLGVALAVVLTVYRALSAPSEEEGEEGRTHH